MKSFETPILFLVFNRPEMTLRVFNKIREIKPKHLFIAADGPRKGVPGDVEKCRNVQTIIDKGIDWECQVYKLYRDKNLGCGLAVSSAIDWFFKQVEEGIILEDDTLPDYSFFNYCEIVLDKYRHNRSVMHISGCYFLSDCGEILTDSYYFTKHIHVWGWATWKRAWDQYDYSMKLFPSKRKFLKKHYGKYADFWDKIFFDTYQGKIDTWDYQWMYTVFINDGICINPTLNLIENIGFNIDATHTKDAGSIFNSMIGKSLSGITKHPAGIKVNLRKDALYYKNYLHAEPQNMTIATKSITLLKRVIYKMSNRKSDINGLSLKERSRLNQLPRYQATETIFFGHTFKLVDASTFMSSYYEIFQDQIYLFKTNHPAPVIIDCGANIGLATIFFKQMHPNAIVHSFEPDANLYAAMKFNIESFGFKQVSCNNKAISTNNDELLFQKEGGHSGMLVNHDGKNIVKVKALRLRDFLEKEENISFLKIDIEGHEDEVLIDIKDQLSKVEYLFVEYHSFIGKKQALSSMLELLTDAGFRYYIKEAYNKKFPFIDKEIFFEMDLLLNIFCYRVN